MNYESGSRPSTGRFLARFAIVVAVAIPLGYMLEGSALDPSIKWILGFIGAGIGGAWANSPAKSGSADSK